jgi:hypothetical protein
VADVDAEVMKFVEDTLKKSPTIQLEELFTRAKGVSTSIRKLSKRQFNARYPLQVKRRRAQSARKKGPKTRMAGSTSSSGPRRLSLGRGGEGREGVRQIFLQFATDIAGAEEGKDLVMVLANVDRYVDQALKKMR